jgi:hypothetical protein
MMLIRGVLDASQGKYARKLGAQLDRAFLGDKCNVPEAELARSDATFALASFRYSDVAVLLDAELENEIDDLLFTAVGPEDLSWKRSHHLGQWIRAISNQSRQVFEAY